VLRWDCFPVTIILREAAETLIPAAVVRDVEPDYLPLLHHSILRFATPLLPPTNFLFSTENTVSQVSKS